MGRLVDFFIAGVQKGGTTALASYLGRHSQIQMSRVKEVHHFDNESLDWQTPDHNPLHAEFDWNAVYPIRGEATPIYSYWPPALSRLRQYNYDAKLIVLLRHPTFRALSHWRMEAVRRYDDFSFEDAISETGRRRVRESPSGVHRVFSYVERGFYADQIERILQSFSRLQVHFLRTDRLWDWPEQNLGDIEKFLGLRPELSRGIQREYIVPVASSHFSGISGVARRQLDTMYEADIRSCAKLTGLDLADWLSPDYREPMSDDAFQRKTERAA